MTEVRDRTPTGLMTPETYLGYARADRFVGEDETHGVPSTYHFPSSIPTHHLALGGLWTVLEERAVAGPGARLRFHFEASKVYLVLGGHGKVRGLRQRPPGAHGAGRRRSALHARQLTARAGRAPRAALHTGVSAYAFTFG
jgi:hypothetical protein